MAISKKGLRKITVNDCCFVYKVSKGKDLSDWRDSKNELDTTFQKHANRYGLGAVKDINFNIVVQSKERAQSKLLVSIKTILVDGFLGPEQTIQIKPQQIASLITKALKEGWNPHIKGDYKLSLQDNDTNEKTPVILQLPNMNEDLTDYENIDRAIDLKINDSDYNK